MSIVVAHEAAKLIREMDEALPHIEGLSVRVSEFLRTHDYVEDVGVFKVDEDVYFDPSCNGSMAQHAKIVASYGTPDGRVLYDVALSFNGGESYAVTVPLRDVVPAFIRGIGEATANGIAPKEIQSDVRSDSECKVPPSGWSCTRDAGHEGPCAAIPQNAEVEKQ